MITWQVQKIVLRHLDSYYVFKDTKVPTLVKFFIVAILQDFSEKLLYEFEIGARDMVALKSIIYEMACNNLKCLIYSKDNTVPDEVRYFAQIKMKNFKDVNLEIDEETIPINFGKYIGQDITKINRNYFKMIRESEVLKTTTQYPKLQEYLNNLFDK